MRVLIFCDILGQAAQGLIEATLVEAALRDDVEVVGFVTANPDVTRPLPTADRSRHAARRVLTAATSRQRLENLRPFDLKKLASGRELPLFAVADSVNDAEFLDIVFDATHPDVLFNINGVQIFTPETIDRFGDAINYHDGLLPRYAGRSATSQSVYHGEDQTGFTFHRLTVAVDGGPILVQGAVGTEGTAKEVMRRKVDASVRAIPLVFDALVEGKAGEPQDGPRSYFSLADSQAITTIVDPGLLSSDELLRRDRAFRQLRITIDGRPENVTALAAAGAGDPFAFSTADGVLRATEISDLPAQMVALRRRIGR